MTIADFFANITKCTCPKLSESECYCNTVQDFYENCVKATLPKEEVIRSWHKLLMNYVRDPKAIFFVRRYASSKDKDGKWDIRRGFLTVYNNVKYVFVDNFFAHYFYAMAINGFVPEYDDFIQFINNREMPYGWSKVSKEEKYQAYPKGHTYPLNKNGWKLSHVFSANDKDYYFNYKTIATDLFPRGDYDDFKVHPGDNYPYWKKDKDVSDEDKNRIIAHFLRVVHPINYFLTPMVKNQESELGFKDIGEYPEMIAFMKNKLAERYRDIYYEYLDMIMARTMESPIGLKYMKGLVKK